VYKDFGMISLKNKVGSVGNCRYFEITLYEIPMLLIHIRFMSFGILICGDCRGLVTD